MAKTKNKFPGSLPPPPPQQPENARLCAAAPAPRRGEANFATGEKQTGGHPPHLDPGSACRPRCAQHPGSAPRICVSDMTGSIDPGSDGVPDLYGINDSRSGVPGSAAPRIWGPGSVASKNDARIFGPIRATDPGHGFGEQNFFNLNFLENGAS